MLGWLNVLHFTEPQEIVDVIVFLISDKSSMITGTLLPIDGGYTCTYKSNNLKSLEIYCPSMNYILLSINISLIAFIP